MRPCTPDQLPLIGKVPRYENLLVASGHCRLGIALAAATGYTVESMIAEKALPEGLLSHFDSARFV